MRKKFTWCVCVLLGTLLSTTSSEAVAHKATDAVKVTIPDNCNGPTPTITNESMRRYTETRSAIGRALAYVAAKRHQEALGWYQKAIDIDPASTRSYIERAKEYLHIDEPKEALADLNAAIKICPCEEQPYELRVSAFLLVHDYPNALANADALVSHTPSVAHYSLRADVKQKSGDKKGAVADFESAVMAAEMHGDDAMDTMDQLEDLVGHKVERPCPNDVGAVELLKVIDRIARDERRFSLPFAAEQIHLAPMETPGVEHPELLRLNFWTVGKGPTIERAWESDQNGG